MSPQLLRTLLLIAMAISIILGVWTAWPMAASQRNDLGYYSHCPFTPWSTLTLFGLAGLCWLVRGYVEPARK